jgi:hypothetical protein
MGIIGDYPIKEVNMAMTALKQNHVKGMGNDLGSFFNLLYNEVVFLNFKWNELIELFGKGTSRVDLLNKAASNFFYIVKNAMVDDTLLHITRLTESKSTAGKDNLTIQRLPDLVVDKIKTDVQDLVDDALKKRKFARDHRNRRIAHKDLPLAMNNAKPLEIATHDKVGEAIDAIGAVLNAVASHYLNSHIKFNKPITTPGTALNLLYVIDDGLKANEELRKRLDAGDCTGHYKSRDWK